jgi:hypothetical protein
MLFVNSCVLYSFIPIVWSFRVKTKKKVVLVHTNAHVSVHTNVLLIHSSIYITHSIHTQGALMCLLLQCCKLPAPFVCCWNFQAC